MSNYLTIDVGGTNIKFAVMNENIEIIEKGEIRTPRTNLEDFENAIVSIYEMYKDRNLRAICMSAPGKIDSSNGYFYTSGALGYVSGVNLRDELKDRIPLPFCVENDAKAAALAELWQGSMKGYDSGSVITLGTGIGGSVILGGKLVRGNTFAAGEFSGISTGWGVKYGKAKSWASTASTNALVGMYAAKKNLEMSEVSGRTFFDAANAGEADALEVLSDFCDSVVCGIVSLQLILDVQRFSFGGGISKQPILMETINRKLDEVFAEQPHSPATRPEVVACTFGNDANMIGALYHYLYELN
ncbi:MAG: ROK family protein [Solobacterium sp.]|nr:ROK family protein [Solobacterium sp.]